MGVEAPRAAANTLSQSKSQHKFVKCCLLACCMLLACGDISGEEVVAIYDCTFSPEIYEADNKQASNSLL